VDLLEVIPENQPDTYEQIWAALARRFGYLDEPVRATQRFDNRRQGQTEYIATYEQAFQSIYTEENLFMNQAVEVHALASIGE